MSEVKSPAVAGRPARRPDTSDLVATSCGTAVAAVCALGLFHIEQTLGGLWSVAAVALAGGLSAALVRVFGRLAAVVPSGVSLLAYVSRAFGRRAGIAIAAPYLLLTLFLVGAEATIVGLVVATLAPVPAPVGALAFLLGTWLVCRTGVRVGYLAQAIATWGLLAGLAGLSLVTIVGAAWRGEIAARLIPPAPTPLALVGGVGQAMFLFMGFELITAQVELASPRVVRRALGYSVGILAAFYALVSLGFSCLASPPRGGPGTFVPQLAIAEQAGGAAALAFVALLSVLASFTSFNGALLSLSRFTYALASQDALPRRLARVEPRSLVPRPAMTALLVVALGATALVQAGNLLTPSILAAAVTAALMYAAAALARERPPFDGVSRGLLPRLGGLSLAAALIGLAVGVVIGAGPFRAAMLGVLIAAYAMAAGACVRAGRRRARPATSPVRGPAHAD